MTLTLAAQKILAGAQSGALENMDAPLQELSSLLTRNVAREDVLTALALMTDARKAAYAHRHRIATNLRQLELSSAYAGSSPKIQASWQLLG